VFQKAVQGRRRSCGFLFRKLRDCGHRRCREWRWPTKRLLRYRAGPWRKLSRCQCLRGRNLDSAYRYRNPSRYVFKLYGKFPKPERYLISNHLMGSKIQSPGSCGSNGNDRKSFPSFASEKLSDTRARQSHGNTLSFHRRSTQYFATVATCDQHRFRIAVPRTRKRGFDSPPGVSSKLCSHNRAYF
jgi:hypothetical protein